MSCVPIWRWQAKKALAEKVLDLSRGEDQKPPRIKISPAQVTSIIWRKHAVH